MNLDIHDGLVMLVVLTALGAVAGVWGGIRAIRQGQKIAYYRLRQKQVAAGWWTILFGLCLVGVAFVVGRFGEPVAYRYFPPSPSPSLTPSISLTPTISQTPTISETPTITLTPAESYTPTVTVTPFMPMAVEAQFESVVTPNPAAIFSPLTFSQSIANYQAVNPATSFENPVKQIFVTYSYDGMTEGVQWTALWYRDGELVYYETGAWEGGTGGYGYAEWYPPAEEWLEGSYQVIFFVGMEWKTLGEFRVFGIPPTPTLTRTPTLTPLPSSTPTPSRTPLPTDTRWPTATK